MANETIEWDSDFPLKDNPSALDAVMIMDKSTGKPAKVTFESLQANAAANVIGSMTPDGSPSGTESVGQSYMVSNTKPVPSPDDGSNDDIYVNFLDSSGNPVIVPAYTSGYLIKNSDGWAFSEQVVNINSVMSQLGLSFIQNPEFVYAIVDAERKILFGIRTDGTIFSDQSEKITLLQAQVGGILTDIAFIQSVTQFFSDFEDVEDRLSITQDDEGKILSFRDKKGVLHELAGLETSQLKFSGDGMSDLIKDLKAAGLQAGKGDQSDNDLVQIPFPDQICYMDFDIPETSLPNTTDESIEVECNVQFWDTRGNYFKKPVKLSTQGDSSLLFYRKNFSLDIDDGSEWKFGNYCATDGFHLKGYYEDAFRGKEIMAMRLFKDVINSRPYTERYAFYEQYQAPSIYSAIGDLQFDSNSVAKYVPDGFPVAIYCQGVFYGCYVLKYKKERDNMDIKKKNTDHVWIDGTPGDGKLIFISDPDDIVWSGIPVKSPSGLKDIDGNDYDDDFPKELSDTDPNSLHVKNIIRNLAGSVTAIENESTTEAKRAKFLEYFDLNSLIDYFLFSNVIYSHDIPKNWQWYTKNGGGKWALAVWDLNLIFGIETNGNTINERVETDIVGISPYSPMKLLTTLFADELLERYTQLRSKIFTTTYIVDKLKSWLNQVTYSKLSADLDRWPETPSYRDGKIDWGNWVCIGANGGYDLWNESTAYNIGDKVSIPAGPYDKLYSFKAVQQNTGKIPVAGVYANRPYECGFFDSLDRVRQVVDLRIALTDDLIGYSN